MPECARSSDESCIGIYIHVPYCRCRCDYCGFYTAGLRIAEWPAFRKSIVGELMARRDEISGPVRTIYIGGGTPSLMPDEELSEMLGEIRQICNAEQPNPTGCHDADGTILEVTLEANPDDVSEQKVAAWSAMGINRISMGIQSFDDGELRMLGRTHDSRHVAEAIGILKRGMENFSIDLIFGIPGQTLEDWKNNLLRAIDTHSPHISCYSLSYEERTALKLKRDRGERHEAEDTDAEAMYAVAHRMLAEAGYRHYEVSNFSLPGYQSRHNTNYWVGGAYIGLGPSACSYDGINRRRSNIPDVKGYLDKAEVSHEMEILSPDELRTEMVMTRLRLAEGLELGEMETAFGKKASEGIIRRARPWIKDGKMEIVENADGSGRYLRVIPSAWILLDSIIVSLI